MRITIDESRCMGHGRCYAVAEDLLSDDEEGFVAQRGQSWTVPAQLTDQAREAADGCPEAAIELSTEPAAEVST